MQPRLAHTSTQESVSLSETADFCLSFYPKYVNIELRLLQLDFTMENDSYYTIRVQNWEIYAQCFRQQKN